MRYVQVSHWLIKADFSHFAVDNVIFSQVQLDTTVKKVSVTNRYKFPFSGVQHVL